MSRTYCLGKQAKRTDLRTLQVSAYVNLSTIQETPAAFDWSMVDGRDLAYPMLANDIYGDCVCASALHMQGTWTGQTGNERILTDDMALDAYGRFTGWRRDDPATDRGAVMIDVATRWRRDPIGDVTIKAFAEVDRRNVDLVRAAANLFGGLWTGWALPRAWQDESAWWTAGPDTSGKWERGSWGGHAVAVVAISPQGLVVRTWGGRRFVTWQAFSIYCDEAYALVPDGLWTTLTGNRCPAGVDGAGLVNDLHIVTG
jgi:hypothetical protein